MSDNHECMSLIELVNRLHDEQCELWNAGQPRSVESYLAEYPRLRESPERIVDLIYWEFRLREANGESACPQEYCDKYPELSPLLSRQFEVHAQLLEEPAVAFEDTKLDVPVDVPPVLVPQTGDVLVGRYRLERSLGRGAFGVVWRAQQLDGEGAVVRTVAVKLLPPELQHDAVELGRVKQVFRKVEALQHQNLCPIYDLADDSRFKVCLVMKCLEYTDEQGAPKPYQTLGEFAYRYRKQHGRLSVEAVVKLLTPVAQALDYIHSQKLVHRDLKPANILLRPDGADIQVVDMGLAAEIRSSMSKLSRGTQDLAGTAPYMAPEQWRGQPLDGKADQWALATIAYELLAGRLPFECPNNTAWMHCAINEQLPEAEGISQPVLEILQQARAADKQERFANCLALVKELIMPGSSPAKSKGGRVPVTDPEIAEESSSYQAPAETSRESAPTIQPASTTIKDIATERAAPPVTKSADFKLSRWVTLANCRKRVAAHRVKVVGAVVILLLGWLIGSFVYLSSLPTAAGMGMGFVRIEPGSFTMGSNDGDDNEKPPHQVTISQPFYLQTTEVTQSQWKAVMGTEPWKGKDQVLEGSNYPATYVSWEDAAVFCEKLSQREGKKYRLPTEAEWEYACRAGTTTEYSFGDDEDQLGQYAWYEKNTLDILEIYHEVGRKLPNPWGLYDMHGNVYEWCSDWYGAYPNGSVNDPQGHSRGSSRVFRGGGWSSAAGFSRSASRNGIRPSYRFHDLGFRLALSPSGQ